MSDDYLRNPAGRLWLFMSHLRDEGPNNQSVLHSWAKYFGLPARYDGAFAAAMAEMLSQPNELRLAVEELDDPPIDKDVLLESIPGVELALGSITSAYNQIAQTRATIDNGTLTNLKMCSGILNRLGAPSARFERQSLEEVRDLVDGLILVATEDTVLRPEIRRVILHHATRMKEAIHLSFSMGAEVVRRESDRLVGSLVSNPLISQEVKSRSPKILEKIMGVIVAINAITVLSGAPMSIAENARDLGELMSPRATLVVEAPVLRVDEMHHTV